MWFPAKELPWLLSLLPLPFYRSAYLAGEFCFHSESDAVYNLLMRKHKLLAIGISLSILFPASSFAMGSGDKYSDLQTGVTFVVYKPSNTLKLAPLNFEVRPCRLFPKKDAYLLAGFGGMDHGIALVETAAAFNCTGEDNPMPLPSIVINGMKAKVGIYCSTGKCKSSEFSRYGGEISFITPPTKSLKATFIRVGTQGGFTLAQLTAFATGLKPVGSK